MRALSDREKRTIRLAAIALGVYLCLFYGYGAWRYLEEKRAEHSLLLAQAEEIKRQILREKLKAERFWKLKESLSLEPASQKRAGLVAEAGAAIQKAARAQGLQLGPSRETPGRSSQRELSTIQIEGQGSALGAVRFLHSLESLGFPILIDGIQLKAVAAKPGEVQLSLGVAVLSFEAFEAEVKKSG